MVAPMQWGPLWTCCFFFRMLARPVWTRRRPMAVMSFPVLAAKSCCHDGQCSDGCRYPWPVAYVANQNSACVALMRNEELKNPKANSPNPFEWYMPPGVWSNSKGVICFEREDKKRDGCLNSSRAPNVMDVKQHFLRIRNCLQPESWFQKAHQALGQLVRELEEELGLKQITSSLTWIRAEAQTVFKPRAVPTCLHSIWNDLFPIERNYDRSNS